MISLPTDAHYGHYDQLYLFDKFNVGDAFDSYSGGNFDGDGDDEVRGTLVT